jgi:hypothetical protein
MSIACTQDHPKKAHRAESVAKRGDSRMTKSVAGHVTIYAEAKWGLQDLVTEKQRQLAQKEMYDFLKWKLGSPFLVATQFVTAGYQHFDKAHVDEAAAALLGVKLPGDGNAQMSLPPEAVKWLKDQSEALGVSLQKFLVEEWGLPPVAAKFVANFVLERANKSISRIGFDWPKKWDVEDRLVKGLIEARRNPAPTVPTGVLPPNVRLPGKLPNRRR